MHIPPQHRVFYGALCCVMALLSYYWVDEPLALMLRHHYNDIYYISSYATYLGSSLPYFMLCVVGFFIAIMIKNKYTYGAKKIYEYSVIYFVTLSVSGLISVILKLLIGRPRPKIWFEEADTGFYFLQGIVDYASMPSGHATTLYALYITTILCLPHHPSEKNMGGGFIYNNKLTSSNKGCAFSTFFIRYYFCFWGCDDYIPLIRLY